MGFLSKLHKKHKKVVTGGTSKAAKLSPGAKMLTGGNGAKSSLKAPSMSTPSKPSPAANRASRQMSNLGSRSTRKYKA